MRSAENRILITGGAGFIGSHLCENYTLEGYPVTCLDNLMSGSIDNIRELLNHQNFSWVEGSIRNLPLVKRIVREVDTVFHLAAQIHVDRSTVQPKLTFDVNVTGTQNILEAARRYDKRVIHTSTSEVYGSARYVPIDEAHPLSAPHLYGASKIAADRMCYAYVRSYGLDIPILRLFNTFGPRQRGEMGYGGVISIFTKRILQGNPPIIYGDGLQTRDYTYIKDIIRAYDLVFQYPKPLTEPINFGTGREIKILDLAKKIIELCGTGRKLAPVHMEPRVGEVRRMVANPQTAKELLQWEAKWTLEDGLKEFIQWETQTLEDSTE